GQPLGRGGGGEVAPRRGPALEDGLAGDEEDDVVGEERHEAALVAERAGERRVKAVERQDLETRRREVLADLALVGGGGAGERECKDEGECTHGRLLSPRMVRAPR